MASPRHLSVLERLLEHDLGSVAYKLGFVAASPSPISWELAIAACGAIDALSRETDEESHRQLITVCALLWGYHAPAWTGLGAILSTALIRAGFSPSTVMVDPERKSVAEPGLSLESSVSEHFAVVNQMKYEVLVGGAWYQLTAFQHRIWERMTTTKLLGISAPTSAGKSFVIALRVFARMLESPGTIVYIVPTLSLVAQVSSDIRKLLRASNLQATVTNVYEGGDYPDRCIFVLTQERAISAFSSQDVPFSKLALLIVDEIQNIDGDAEDNDERRARILFDLLTEFRNIHSPELTLISGPRVRGLVKFGYEVFGEQDSTEETTKDSPVASITYSVGTRGREFYLSQYTTVWPHPHSLRIDRADLIIGYGLAQYSQAFHFYLSHLIRSLGPGAKNLVFSPTSRQARLTALALSENESGFSPSAELDTLVQYLRESVHPKYDLCSSIIHGIAYHHGKMPMHVRHVVEFAIREDLIPNIVCTTTLMQGVNLPTQNVIIRNPFLAIKSVEGLKPTLSDYDVANLRGRAGRLLKDFVGRTFVLEEDSFDKGGEQADLFQETEKVLTAGYGERFRRNRSAVHDGLSKAEIPNDRNTDYSFLLTYVRQVALRYGVEAEEHLSQVGIDLSQGMLTETLRQLSSLSIPIAICRANRYWDPLDLERLYLRRHSFSLPTNPRELNLADKMRYTLLMLQQIVPFYFKNHLGAKNFRMDPVVFGAVDWVSEKRLSTILSREYFSDSNKVESHISFLQSKIAFDLPALLKPIYDILTPQSTFLRSLELGAYLPVTRHLIEIGLARETAISVRALVAEYLSETSAPTAPALAVALRAALPRLSYWERIQVEALLLDSPT